MAVQSGCWYQSKAFIHGAIIGYELSHSEYCDGSFFGRVADAFASEAVQVVPSSFGSSAAAAVVCKSERLGILLKASVSNVMNHVLSQQIRF
jgi:hypothetical protein